MTSDNFDYSSFIKHAIAYFRARLKREILRAGSFANKAIKQGVNWIVLSIFAPLILLLLFIALGYGLHDWLGWSLGLSFLLSALVAILLCLVAIVLGIAATRKMRASMLEKIMTQLDKLEVSSKGSSLKEEHTPPLPED